MENEVAERRLAEIKIEEDASALDSFLESTDVTPSSDRPSGKPFASLPSYTARTNCQNSFP